MEIHATFAVSGFVLILFSHILNRYFTRYIRIYYKTNHSIHINKYQV